MDKQPKLRLVSDELTKVRAILTNKDMSESDRIKQATLQQEVASKHLYAYCVEFYNK